MVCRIYRPCKPFDESQFAEAPFTRAVLDLVLRSYDLAALTRPHVPDGNTNLRNLNMASRLLTEARRVVAAAARKAGKQ